MFLIVACVLVVAWLLGLFVFKITKGAIHIILIIAVIAIVLHFMRQP